MLLRFEKFEPGTLWVLGRSPAGLGIDPSIPDPRGGSRSIEARLRESLTSIPSRPDLSRWVEWRGSPSHPQWDELAKAALQELQGKGEIAGWGLRLTDPRDATQPPTVIVRSDSVSLLDRRWETPLSTELPAGSFLARDPMAGGRLDGTRWDRSLTAWSGPEGPTPFRRLQEEVAPVLQLGFLTDGTGRTLAQSALQYLAGFPAVASILAPLPLPERLPPLLEFARTPPISEEERDRISRGAELVPSPDPLGSEALARSWDRVPR
ncbi:MAG: hypothetical protein ABSA15_02705 [Thermoplasmata archaeon]|jgi:aryl-alcohol dehydrogenase-like predicted oxidoreductase